ncbi:hypothetical protein COV23_00820 [Candidatus Wolfebacteria bacterium CG10_big_fil_rev_8_21_14_0_10_31_9]|uniref:RNA polymerase subunit sigma-70 n=1 Tax=Candidatus Wolfebacteria bacterium CG10_big_fil_rev_8_21_14_0_10_31_9 TaxID=1975070 RepID=A0A2H0REP3_9BACT|nr:MAG: hypothetical protein COV23_00820 [Candidatus Wolfebacteria bacterium CG10_big_fil_rev_8_21_14_0_10_31_9]
MLDGDEKSIIKSAIDGEASAFGSLYDKYHSKIYRFIYLKVSHREEAEDLAHQVFLNAWQNISKYKFQGLPFSSWLYQIARNQVIDHYRTKKVTVNLEIIEEIFISDYSVDKEVGSILELETARKAILKLNQEQQDIIIMRFVEDLSPKEISQTLGKPESTIRVLQHRAIQNLKKILKNEST